MRVVFLVLTIIFFTSSSGFAQVKMDVLTLNTGDKKEGKVTSITETTIKFRYPGEDFDYEISKKDVNQIEFASGRVEKFTSGESMTGTMPNTNPGSAQDRHNKIAVLPFDFISNDPGLQSESMKTLSQSTTANFVKTEYSSLALQDPITTNAILAKNNVNNNNISEFTPIEIAQLLGVEYIIYGTVNITNKGTTTYGSAGTTYNQKQTTTYSNNKSDDRTKGGVYSSSTSTSLVQYDTSVDLKMFNDRGDNLYSQSRHVFGTAIDNYKNGVQFMLKRTPFGSKYGK